MKKTRRILIKLLKTHDKEETLTLARGKKTHYVEKRRYGRLLIRGDASGKLVEQPLKHGKKKRERQESYTHELPFKNESIKKKKTFSKIQKLEEFVTHRPALCRKKSFRQKERK